jgi:hypothetical protein
MEDTNKLLEHILENQAETMQENNLLLEGIHTEIEKKDTDKLLEHILVKMDEMDSNRSKSVFDGIEVVKGKQGDKGDKGDSPTPEELTALIEPLLPSTEDFTAMIEPLIPAPIKGEDGQDYILTDEDKKQIAQNIEVPIVEKVIEKTIIEKPITIDKTVTKVKEVAKYETAEEIASKLNTLTKQIDFKVIKNFPDLSKTIGVGYLRELSDVNIGRTDPTNGQTLVWDAVNRYWKAGTIASGTVWGSITGTLSDQTDLQNALDAKVSGTGSPGQITYWDSISSITGNDNFFYDSTLGSLKAGYINGGSIIATGLGSFATGSAADNTIGAIGDGAFAIGKIAGGGTIQANGAASFAGGFALDGSSQITANDNASFAFGGVESGRSVVAGNAGTLAFGYALTGDIRANNVNSIAIGDNLLNNGTNSQLFGQAGQTDKDNSVLFALGGNITSLGDSNTFAVGYNGSFIFKTNTTSTEFQSLAGSGTQMVVANNNGVLSRQAIPTGTVSGTGVSGQATFWNGTSSIAGDTTYLWDNTNKLLNVGGGTPTTTINNQLAFQATKTNTSYFAAIQAQNLSNGTSASTDYILANDAGTDTTNYLDLGINSSTNTDASYTAMGLGAGYLYNQSGDLVIGTASAKSIKFITGGTLTANIRGSFDSTGNFYLNNLTAGSVPFVGASGLITQNNTNFFFDNSTAYLSIGIGASASSRLELGTGNQTTPNSTAGLALRNTIAASAGTFSVQVPGSVYQKGSAWNTTSLASQFVEFRQDMVPTSGATIGGSWILKGAINGGTLNNLISVNNLGVLSIFEPGVSTRFSFTGAGRSDFYFNGMYFSSRGSSVLLQTGSAPDSSGITNAAGFTSIATSGAQMVAMYNNTNYLKTTVQSSGSVAFSLTGSGDATYNFDIGSTTITGAANLWYFSHGNGSTATSGTSRAGYFLSGFRPSSGTGTYTGIEISTTINQTGGANGITRGLYINPTLTASADFRAIETTQGKNILADTTAAGSGSLAGSLLSMTQTWNTTGSPTSILLNVTNTASGASANLMDLQIAAASKFKIDKTGGMISAANGIALAGTSFTSGKFTYGGSSSFQFLQSTGITGANTATLLDLSTISISPTSGTTGLVGVSGTFAPTSGTSVLNAFTINPIINQTGGANGITRGIYVNPTLTAAADFRAIETNVATGTGRYAYFGAGTAPAVFGGTVRLKGYTVATLPAGTVGDTAYASDLLAPTFGAVAVGGGATVAPVFFNGTQWITY